VEGLLETFLPLVIYLSMKTKVCRTCHGKPQPVSAFYKNGAKGYYSSCIICQRKKYRKLYQTSAKERKVRAERWKKRIQRARDFVYSLLDKMSCVDCGESRLETLDFDHVRGRKIASISHMMKKHFSIPKIKKEIAKCEVRCANCHRIKTAKELGWSRSDWLQSKVALQ
jgi:hypothetical protein